MPKAAGELRAAAAPTSTAAMPTSEWKPAISWGIAVIGMRLAIVAPTVPPMATHTMMMTQARNPLGSAANSVVTTAMAMPIMPNWLPWRAVSGCDSPLSARMNRAPATR
jgi:hypothetical protein